MYMNENDRVLLRVHRNELFETCRDAGLDPSDFEWTIIDSKRTRGTRVPSLIHRPSGHMFVFDFDPNQGAGPYVSDYSPGATHTGMESCYDAHINGQLRTASQ